MSDTVAGDPGAAGGGGTGPRKKRKRSFVEGVRERILTLGRLLATLIEQPRAFPGELRRVIRQWARDTWEAQGGGFYACGFVVTFAWLETKLLFTELFGSESAADFFFGQFLQLVLRFTLESLLNTVLAFLWPMLVLRWSPVLGLILLVGGYLVFRRWAKAPLTRWLFDDGPPAGDEDGRQS